MQKPLKITLVVLAFIVLVPAAKRLYLYHTYEHGNVAMERISGEANELRGRWVFDYDSYCCGFDQRNHVILDIENDSTAKMEWFGSAEKIAGTGAMVNTWSALIPYDKDKTVHVKYNAVIKDNRLTCVSYNREWVSTERYTIALRNDSLYIRDWDLPEDIAWGMWCSAKIELPNLLDPGFIYYEWCDFFTELFDLINDEFFYEDPLLNSM